MYTFLLNSLRVQSKKTSLKSVMRPVSESARANAVIIRTVKIRGTSRGKTDIASEAETEDLTEETNFMIASI